MLEWARETILVPDSVFPEMLSLKYTISYYDITTALDFSFSNILFFSNALYLIIFKSW